MWLFGALLMVLLGVMVSGPLKQRLAQLKSGDWRPGAGVLAIAASIGGLFMIVREAFAPGAVLLAVGISGLIAARKRAQAQSNLKAPLSMDRSEAASILGLKQPARLRFRPRICA